MDSEMMNVGIFISDLLEKTRLDDTDWVMAEDIQNTKKIMFRNFRQSLISDNEAPADYRIFSSSKVQDLVTTVNDKFDKRCGELAESFAALKTTAITQKQLEAAINAIDEKKTDKTTTDSVIKELEATRKKSEYITGKDIVCATEEEKIHLDHLGTDVRDAMTGNTPVSVLAAPAGGWPAEDIADKSISARKFTIDYTYKGNITDGDMNRLVETGIYEVAADVEGLPHWGDDMDETRMVVVERYGKDNGWIRQRVYYKEFTNEARPYFERKGMFTKLSILNFITKFDVSSDNKVTADLLGDEYCNRGLVTSGSIFDLTKDGNYLCYEGVKGLPTAEKYVVNVRNFGDRREYEAKRADLNGCITYCCYRYPDSSGEIHITDWFNTTNLTKSKFDGTYIHVFGDGISYGLGASDSVNTTYTSILHRKYGYHLVVHALADATAGNYNEVVARTSLLTQIDTAVQMDEGDDYLVLIFIGGEDFRKGLCSIGDNDYKGEDTFKGALNLAIEKILTKHNQARIMFATPLYRSSSEPGDNLDCDTNMINGKYLKSFSDAVVEVAAANHIPCLNLFENGMINKYNASKYLTSNGVYPNDKGHALIAEKIHNAFCYFY